MSDHAHSVPLKTSSGDELFIVHPIITYIIGILFSLAVGLLAGLLMAKVFVIYSEKPEYSFIAFYPIAFAVGFWFFMLGSGCAVPVGFLGVTTLIGERTDKYRLFGLERFLPFLGDEVVLSEGNHWMFPRLMNYIPVDHHVQTSKEIQVAGLSKDGIRMTGVMFYKFQVTRPFLFLGAENQEESIDQVGEAMFRNTFADHDASGLAQSDTQSGIAAHVQHQLADTADHQYGVGLIDVFVKSIRLPPEVEAAQAKKREQEAILAANELSIAKLEEWMERLMRQGFTRQEAIEAVQTDLGKRTVTQTINSYQGLETLATILAQAAKEIWSKKENA